MLHIEPYGIVYGEAVRGVEGRRPLVGANINQVCRKVTSARGREGVRIKPISK